MSEQRRRLRDRLRNERARIPHSDRLVAAKLLVRQFFRQPGFRRARRIAMYCPSGSEIDVWPLIHASLAAKKRIYFPQIRGEMLRFVPWRVDAPLRTGAFGILEPADGPSPTHVRTLDWVVVPLLGFDPNGNRLGQGGGYYDRTFSLYRHRLWRRPKLTGVAFDTQYCAHIDAMHWDVCLDFVVTPNRLYRM